MTSPDSLDLDHARHDPALIAALADRDAADALRPFELDLARARQDRCPACAALHRDLVDLMAGLQTGSTPVRPRDFRLTAADAARLQPGGLRGFLRTIGSARDGLTRPLAIGLTTLGLVGVLVGTVPGVLPFGGSGGTAGEDASTMAGQRSYAPTDGAVPAAGGPVVPESTSHLEMTTDDPDIAAQADGYVFNGAGFEQSTESDGASRQVAAPADVSLRDDPSGISVMVVIAGTMLILGLGLFALRWSSRRFG